MLLVAVGGLAFFGVASSQKAPPSQDALELQKTREKFVKERAAQTYYPADKFDLSGLPAYQPGAKIGGKPRIWGNNYIADSGLADVWEKGFRKFHPDVDIEWNLRSAATAVGALWSGAADDGIFGSAREGGWGKDFEWHRDIARGPEKNIRTWGQLGLTGEWADKPINVYGLNLRYEQSLRISDPILKGRD